MTDTPASPKTPNDASSHGGDDADPGFFFRPKVVNTIFYSLVGIVVLLTISELLYAHHPHFDIEGIPTFFEIFGFLAFILIAFAGKWLRVLIMRREDYYDRRS